MLAEATEGPWVYDGNLILAFTERVIVGRVDEPDGEFIAESRNSLPGMIEVVRCGREVVAAHDAVDDYEDARDPNAPPEPVYERVHDAERALATALANLDSSSEGTNE